MTRGKKRLIVVGGVAAGASAAAKARRMGEDFRITVIEKGPYVSFANCGLPYYVGGEIARRERLFVTSESRLARRFNMEIRCHSQAVRLDRDSQEIEVEEESGRVRRLRYDRLILATGTRPIWPPIQGLRGHPRVHMVRTIPDVDGIMRDLNRLERTRSELGGPPLQAVVVGAGYIGLETAEQLLRRGLSVTLVETAGQVMPLLDAEMAYGLQKELSEAGARLLLNTEIKALCEESGEAWFRTAEGERIPFDVAIVATGVRPAVELGREAGLATGESGAYRVDSFQRTSDPRIFAAGDNCEVLHRVLDRPVHMPLAGPANKMGRVAGANAALDLRGQAEDDPERLRFRGVVGTSLVRCGGTFAASTGLTERQAMGDGIAYQVAYMSGSSHAGYYPDAESFWMKVLFEIDSGRLLGAQVVGGEGVDKRTDILATALFAGLRVEDLEGLDLCYAPPVGSAKDAPVMVGFAGQNMRSDLMPSWTPGELLAALHEDPPPYVLDVRTSEEFDEGHLEGARHLPLEKVRSSLESLPEEGAIAVYCGTGYRSYLAQRILLNSGFENVKNIQGGYRLLSLFQEAGLKF